MADCFGGAWIYFLFSCRCVGGTVFSVESAATVQHWRAAPAFRATTLADQVRGASQRPLTSGVEEVPDAVEVVREWVVACAHDAELAVEGADAGAEPCLDLAEYRRSPDRHGSHRLWCADVKDTEVGRECLVAEPGDRECFCVLGGRIDGDELFGGSRRGQQSVYRACSGGVGGGRAG